MGWTSFKSTLSVPTSRFSAHGRLSGPRCLVISLISGRFPTALPTPHKGAMDKTVDNTPSGRGTPLAYPGSAPLRLDFLIQRILLFLFIVRVDFCSRRQDHYGLGLRVQEGRARPSNVGLPPSWSWESGPSVALPAFDAGSAMQNMARHKSPGPRRSGTPCVLRIASYLSWVLSAQLTTLGSCGGGFTPSSGTTFCGGSSTPA